MRTGSFHSGASPKSHKGYYRGYHSKCRHADKHSYFLNLLLEFVYIVAYKRRYLTEGKTVPRYKSISLSPVIIANSSKVF